jgi:diguanylate cyclase (GGDEF)-like protein
LQSAIQRLEKLAFCDPLTGLGNRRNFTSFLRAELRRAARDDSPLGLVLCDVDDFKACNDRYGHQAGDAVLIAVGETLKRSCRRGGDLAFRHGGDEFALILPGVRAEALRPLCEKLRNEVKSATPVGQGIDGVTVSIGAALLHESTPYYATAFIGIADRALYRAKRDRKDCVKISILEGRHGALRSVR